jgi:protein O-mannosyl-transferase
MSERSKAEAADTQSDLPASRADHVREEEGSRRLTPESAATGRFDRWTVVAVCLVLAAMTWLVFKLTLGYDFVNYDDFVYVADNPVVRGGLSLQGIAWAFTHNVNDNWTPLAVISHMLDCQLYGTNAGWHHLTSVLLHAASAILLFLVLKGVTGARWRSAFVAAVFAIHPLHVESVAWISERRDVLSGLFFMLTLGAYASYVRRPWSWGRYLMVGLMLALAMMSKPMMVTLPFVLLLLDYWPLRRVAQPGCPLVPGRLIVEKIPFLALSIAVCAVTLFAQQEAISTLPLATRIGNALVSYVVYLEQMIYPAGLAVYYPYPAHGLPLGKIIMALFLLLVITTGAAAMQQKRPWLLFGWLWYLGMLVPAIGLIQSGAWAHGDRFTYLPQIGLYLALAWAAADWCAGRRHYRTVLGGGAVVMLVALMFSARAQTAYWRNSETLWTHALDCTSDNFIAENNLGNVLLEKGQVDEAIFHCQKALQITPGFAEAHINIGNALVQKGRVDEAIAQYQEALQIKPANAGADYNLGTALLKKGRVDEAIAQYQIALQIKPDYWEAHNNLSAALLQQGRVDEAIVHGQTALAIMPGVAEAHINLGNALLQKGQLDEAIVQYQTALQTRPRTVDVLNNLAWLLATSPDERVRDGHQAVQYALRACELTQYRLTVFVGTLAAAYAEAGRYDEAVAAARRACAQAEAAGDGDLLEKNRNLLALYLKHQPYHQAASPGQIQPTSNGDH